MQIAYKQIKKNKRRKIYKRYKISFLVAILFLSVGFFINKVFSFDISLSIVTQPPAKTKDTPVVHVRAEVAEGKGITGAIFDFYDLNNNQSAASDDCNARSGFAFGLDETVVEFDCGPTSAASGRYEIRVTVYAEENGNQVSNNIISNQTIVDRQNPEITFNNLEPSTSGGLIINYNEPEFTGNAIDTLTNITSIQYKYLEDVAVGSDTPGSIFDSSGWNDCEAFTEALNVSFTCDPDNTFPNSINQDREHRLYVKAVDELDNSGINYYRFQVDTVDPQNLQIQHPNSSGLEFHAGEDMEIDWTTPTDNFALGSNPIKIEYSSDGSFSEPELEELIDGHKASGSWTWSIPQSQDGTSSGRIRITATDLAGNSISSTSAHDFTIIEYSEPVVIIDDLNEYNIASTTPIYFNVTANDPQGIESASCEVSGGGSILCSCSLDVGSTFGDEEVNLTCEVNGIESDNVYTINVEAIDMLGHSGDNDKVFTYDTTPPTVNAGSLGVISDPTQPGASASDNIDTLEDLTFIWSKVSGPGDIIFSEENILNPFISASQYSEDINDDYVAMLTVCDRAGHCNSDTVSFLWVEDSSGPEVIITPLNEFNTASSSEITIIANASSETNNIMSADYKISAISEDWIPCSSSNFGESEVEIICENINISSLTENLHNIEVRVIDNFNEVGINSYTFRYDISPPTIIIGSLGLINIATKPGAQVSDDGIGVDESSFVWTQVSGSGIVLFEEENDEDPFVSSDIDDFYTIRLEACDLVGNCAFENLEFEWTNDPLNLYIISPEGDDNLTSGENWLIQWSDPGGSNLNYFNVLYNVNGGEWESIASSLSSNTFQFNWSVPYLNSSNVKVRVEAYDSSDNFLLSAESDPFSISLSDFVISYPNADSIYKHNDTLEIEWTSPGGSALHRYKIEYSVNGGSSWTLINNNVASSETSYNWTVANENSINSIIRIEAYDSSDNLLSEAESDEFIIDSTPPAVTLTDIEGTISSPTNSEPYVDVSDNIDNNNQMSYSWTTVSAPGGGSVTFGGGDNIIYPNLSGTVTGEYEVRLTVTDRAGNSNNDTLTFDWDGNPEDFDVLEPSEGDMFKGGTEITISWEESSGADNYNLQYSLDNGASFFSIGQTSSTTYNWSSPPVDSNQVKIRVTALDTHGNSIFSESDLFLIDSTAPIISAGSFSDALRSYTVPNNLFADDGIIGSDIASYSWIQEQAPLGGQLDFSDASILETGMKGTVTGIYTARLTVTDNVGNSSYDTVSFFFIEEPPAPIITRPGKNVFWRGNRSESIEWAIEDPGDLDEFIISFSPDGGVTWQDIDTVSGDQRSIDWTTEEINSTSSQIRVVVFDIDGNSATSTNQFTIDSEAPNITINDLGLIEEETNVNVSVTDNIDSQDDMEYFWDVVNVPSSHIATGTVIFKPSHREMSPNIEATVSGEYKIQIIVQDRAGNISNDYLTFFWDGDPEAVTIINPNSYTFAQGGSELNIKWYLEDSSALNYYDLYYSINNGNDWIEVISGLDKDLREYLWTIPEDINSTSSQIKIDTFDNFGNSTTSISSNFTIDSTPPLVDAGYIESPISLPTATNDLVIEDNFTSVEDLSILWEPLSTPYPQATLHISNATSTDSLFSGDMTGEYELLLSVTDLSGNVGTSTLSFYWLSPFDPEIYKPEEGEFVKGNDTYTIKWNLLDPGNLSHLELEYSIDDGITWQLIDNNIASSSLSFNWGIDEINSTSSRVRLMSVNVDDIKATSTTGLFIIDSEAPIVNAGSFSSNVNQATKPGASASDNFDSLEDLTFVWTKVSGPGNISFGGGANILNPSLEGSRNGDYVAKLTVYDRAGNFSSDTVSFTRRISSGGGGGGIRYCSEVTYGDWGPCINNVEYRSIISTVPPFCTPTSEQRALQTRSCGDILVDCIELVFGDWGPCIDNWQVRDIISRYPANCNLTLSQLEKMGQYCYSDDYSHRGCFDPSSATIVQEARDLYFERDASIINNLMGKILLQVEEGRVWYLNPIDQRKYYLGSPRNAFCVMSLVAEGITNEDLDKLSIGVIDGSLTLDIDSDGDGLPDRLEIALGTDPFNPDTDGDGYDDYTEVIHGYNPLGPGRMPIDPNFLMKHLGKIFLQVKNHGEAWYIEPDKERRYYLGRPEEAFGIIREFGTAISNEDLNKIPVGQFNEEQMRRSKTLIR